MSAGNFCLLINCFIACACGVTDAYSNPFFIADAGAEAEAAPTAHDAAHPDSKARETTEAVTAEAARVETQVDELPQTSAYPRLSHRQWALAAQSLLGLQQAPDVSHFSADPATGTGLDNTSDKLDVAPNLWSDYQRASEELAAQATAEPKALTQRLGLTAHSDPKQFIEALGERAFRRPLTAAERSGYLQLFQAAKELFPERDAFSAGAELTIAALLQAPAFIYRVEESSELDDLELAARLAFTLWDSLPDAELTRVAKQGHLRDPQVLDAQLERMLAAPLAEEKLLEFHRQWLELRRYDAFHSVALPEGIGLMFREEAERFLRATVLDEHGSLRQLFTSSFTFVNDELARLYALPDEFGSAFTRVRLHPAHRSGLLTQPGFLALHAGDTAPILRGVFINRRLLCATLPPPPVFNPGKMEGETRRERVDSVTGKGTCGEACHARLINPAGFALENFDDSGRYRDKDNGYEVDASGSYRFGDLTHSFRGPVEWSNAIADSQQAHACYAKYLLQFSFERSFAPSDAPLVARLAHASQAEQKSVKELVKMIVRTPSFSRRRGGAL